MAIRSRALGRTMFNNEDLNSDPSTHVISVWGGEVETGISLGIAGQSFQLNQLAQYAVRAIVLVRVSTAVMKHHDQK